MMVREMTQTELEDKIKEAQEAYYNSNPIMSDIEFDELWEQLKTNYPDSEVLQDIGNDSNDGFEKAQHIILMGSQNKATKAEEMDAFFKKDEKYIASYKLDGISIEIQYDNGNFVKALTRGDGVIGDNVTNNVIKMGYVPKVLQDKSFTGAVRGEILLQKSVKDKYFPDAKNCRNMASGISKRKDGLDCDKLIVMCYDVQSTDKSKNLSTETLLNEWLKSNGFIVAPYTEAKTWTGKDAIDYINDIFSKLETIDFDIDGIVFKQQKIDWNDKVSSYRPKTNIALKPKYTQATSILRSIEWKLNNGTFTPVAHFDAVELNGTMVENASLANISLMEDMGIEIGHEIIVVKTGLIIPKIIKDVTTGKFAEGYAL